MRILLFISLIGVLLNCESQSPAENTSPPIHPTRTSPPALQGWDLWKTQTPLSDGFDYPVGPPDAKGYYNAQKFGKNYHLGDDWNGLGGGNTDLGDPVFAASNGLVTYAQDHGPGWGNVVRVLHRLDSGQTFVETLYAHLDTLLTSQGDSLKRGQQLGTIGNANGAYYAHLHFELRHTVGLAVGGGYSQNTKGFSDPTAFIKAHRPR